jgi:hypothetical protein
MRGATVSARRAGSPVATSATYLDNSGAPADGRFRRVPAWLADQRTIPPAAVPVATDATYPDNSDVGAPQQTVGFTAFPLSGPTGATVAARHDRENLSGRRRRAAIDQALRGDRRADALGDDALHNDDALDTTGANPDLVTRTNRLGRFGRNAVHANMPATAGFRGGGPGLEKTHRPRPRVHTGLCRGGVLGSRLGGCHP